MKIRPFHFYGPEAQGTLAPELFQNPPCKYRGAPFWSWNNRLDVGQLMRQIDCLKAMGFGGFHMHPRTGLDTPYLSDEYMQVVRACTQRAEREGMLAWLYDEDRWPSGYAGGLVTQHPEHRAKRLLWTRMPYSGAQPDAADGPTEFPLMRTELGEHLWSYEVVLSNGCLESYRRLEFEDAVARAQAGAWIWHAYMEAEYPVVGLNNYTCVDVLSPAAIACFLEETHARYANGIGEYFGGVVPAIFTDEPHFIPKECFERAGDEYDRVIPWTTDFAVGYGRVYGERLEDFLPEIFWELPGERASRARYRYHDYLCDRFTQTYPDALGAWCEAHGVALTGHLVEEKTLTEQTIYNGDVMRGYRSFHIPGIDVIDDRFELTTLKQVQSAAHQFGRKAVLSELYGTTNWDFDFANFKAQGDWQAALGATVRVPHLSWVSMAGESKRDWPASISYQSPWHTQYPLIEDHFSRLNNVLTHGRPVIRVGVVHPIESFWLCFGAMEQTASQRRDREEAFSNLTNWLLFGLIDFNFICEALLPEQYVAIRDGKFTVGEMQYDVVVVPGLRTIRSSTLKCLEEFMAAGGLVVFAGESPELVDAEPSERAAVVAARGERASWSCHGLMRALEPYREIRATAADGTPADSILSQMREEGEYRYLFLCNTDRIHAHECVTLKLRGEWTATILDTFDGATRPLSLDYAEGNSVWNWDFPAHGHLLLELRRGRGVTPASSEKTVWTEATRLEGPVPVTLSEPNALLLDQARFRLDGGPWSELEELQRIEDRVRDSFGLRRRRSHGAQPWCDSEVPARLAELELRFDIECDVAVESVQLAIEKPTEAEIFLNGMPVPGTVTGWFVDEAIQTLTLPALTVGCHELVLRLPFHRKTEVEWCYLLGDFGVKAAGRKARITAPVRELAFGDWTGQGLPFYTGNVVYHCRYTHDTGDEAIHVPHFKAALLTVSVNGSEAQSLAFAPHRAELERLRAGENMLDITAYGHRFNAFGCVHYVDAFNQRISPNHWHSSGVEWAYEYQLKPMGIMAAPLIERRGSG
jgi:hypothetical protein